MDTTRTQYTVLADRLAEVAQQIDDDRWEAASPCEGWSTRDVLDHVITTQRDFLTGHDIDLGAALNATARVHPAQRWQAHAAAVVDALSRPGVAETAFDGFFGPTTVGAALTRFYGFDMIVHRWDLGTAAHVATSFTDAEMDRIEHSIEGFGEHLYGEGICAPPVEIGEHATRQDRLLARLGRDPNADRGLSQP